MIWKKILTNESATITGAAIILAAASILSRLLGFARDRTLAHYFGAGDVIDAYYAAFKIPDLTYNLIILGAFSAGFIPVFTKLFNKNSLNKNKKEAWLLVNNSINTLGVFLIFLTIILIIFAPLLTPIVAPGFTGEKLALTTKLTRIMLLSPLFLGLSTVAGAVLQSLKNFLVYSLSPMLYNLGIIIGAIFLVPFFGPAGLAWGVILGAFLHLIIQLPSMHLAGFRYFFYANLKDKNLITIIKLVIPRTFGLAAGQINSIVMTMLASTMAVGSVAVYNYGFNLQSLPLGLVGVSFAVAAFPLLSEMAHKNETEKIIKTVSAATKQILFLTIPLMLIFLMLRAQIVRVVLGTGAFDWTATIKTADVLAFFALSLFAQSLIPLISRVFYALEDTKTPFFCGIFSVFINILLGWFLTSAPKAIFGVEGLALAFSIASIFNLALLWVFLRLRLKNLNEFEILPSLYKMSVAAIFMGIALQAMKILMDKIVDTHTFFGIFSQGLIAGAFGILVYSLIGLMLKNQEMLALIETIKRRLIKKPLEAMDISDITKQ